mgnify:CR=1 FL=1
MSLFLHILERALLHIVASTFLVVAAYFFNRFAQRKWPEWIPIGVAGLLVFSLIPLREAYDVGAGQPVIKALTDQLSWLLGTAGSAYAIYRLKRS